MDSKKSIHRTIAICLFIFFFIVSVSGFFAWLEKRQAYWLPHKKVFPQTLAIGVPVDSLHKLAVKYLHDSVDEGLSPELDRVDIRPSRGIVKFVFMNHYWDIQLDYTSGEPL